jgi:AcrR family transcriptional regulator
VTTRRTARQDALLGRLTAVLVRDGFAAATLDDLARELRCSKTTLYALAPSKQELVVEVVRQWFRAATTRVESRVAAEVDPGRRVAAYLQAVAAELAGLSRAFLDDLSAFAPADAVYRRNTEAAADRIRALIAEGIDAGALRPVNAAFAAEMVAATMFEIQRGRLFARVGLSDAEAYDELAAFVVGALAPRGDVSAGPGGGTVMP